MSNTRSVDTLNLRSVNSPGVSALRSVLLCAGRLAVIVAKDTSPLLHGLSIVCGAQSSVGAAMIHLHLGAVALVVGVHVENDVGPGLRCGNGVALRAGAVPCIDTVGTGGKAAGSYARVDDSSLEHIGIGRSHDVLG